MVTYQLGMPRRRQYLSTQTDTVRSPVGLCRAVWELLLRPGISECMNTGYGLQPAEPESCDTTCDAANVDLEAMQVDHRDGWRAPPAVIISSAAAAVDGQREVGTEAALLLRRTAELANAAAGLADGVRSVQACLAHALGWTVAGYRVFTGAAIPAPKGKDEPSLSELSTTVAPSVARGRRRGPYRLIVVRVEDGARLAAVFGFLFRRREPSAEEQALLAQVARQLAALARRDIGRQGMLAREFEILHQGQLAGMAEVAQSLSHELSQPLAALGAYAGALRRLLDTGCADQAAISYLGERLLQQVERAGGILQATKTFVLQQSCPTGSVDVEATIRQLAAFVRRELRAASVDLQLDIAAGLPPARGSEPHLAQIVLSLLANAVGALQPVAAAGRRITIRVVQIQREIHIGVVDRGRHLTVAQPLDGQGSFYAAYADSAQMGLAISRSLAEVQGGRLWREENDGETSFIVALPIIH